MVQEAELTNRTIPGITWKQVVAFVIGVVTVVILYLRLEALAQSAFELSKENNILLKEAIQERKETSKINDARLYQMELEHREFDFRLKQLEKFYEGYNNANKKYK
jgi:hypothetical protein